MALDISSKALRNEEENWIRTIICLKATKNCITEFAEDVMLKFRENARNEVVEKKTSSALVVSRGMTFRSPLHVTDEQMNSDLDILELLLTDTKCLKERKATAIALRTIKKIRNNDIKIASEKLEILNGAHTLRL
ncbi:hypothetical protein MAR_033953 [Mya arenaria]|uniref:Uncharacterized protein n=1 Tax=Mya arenaria TaxID=6604 RepID=A0ABY7GEP6_MYAAR|nr:hypothetical protein MAR_033953 [Mya arenaria]